MEDGISLKEFNEVIKVIGEDRAKHIFEKRFVEETDKQIADSMMTEEEELLTLKLIYKRIIIVLKRYCDLKDEYYSLIALWIMGTYCHKEFPTFPYLFFNAMKGSGKSRLLKLIIHLSNNGRLINNMSEAVLFRTASMRTFGIDEFEHVGNKEKQALRELLNSAYKKGTVVERAVKIKTKEEEDYRIDTYDLYCPIVMANIWGMDEVLSDRCISITIDKSSKREITRLLELYDTDQDILYIKSVVSVVTLRPAEHICHWNAFVTDNYTNYTNNTKDTNYTNYTTTLFTKIAQTSLDSRNLELFFPLFVLADSIGELDTMIKLAEDITKTKKDDDTYENRDVMLLEFIANSELTFQESFVSEKDILSKYRMWVGYDEHNKEFEWLNGKWMGRALKRLNLILEKDRHHNGMIVKLNFKKAQEKARMFKTEKIEVEKVS